MNTPVVEEPPGGKPEHRETVTLARIFGERPTAGQATRLWKMAYSGALPSDWLPALARRTNQRGRAYWVRALAARTPAASPSPWFIVAPLRNGAVGGEDALWVERDIYSDDCHAVSGSPPLDRRGYPVPASHQSARRERAEEDDDWW